MGNLRATKRRMNYLTTKQKIKARRSFIKMLRLEGLEWKKRSGPT